MMAPVQFPEGDRGDPEAAHKMGELGCEACNAACKLPVLEYVWANLSRPIWIKTKRL